MRRVVSSIIALLTIGLSSDLLADEEGVSPEGMTARLAAKAYFEEQGTEGVVFRNLYVDRLGQAHVRYDQTYMGIPVFAGQTIVHVKLDEQRITRVTNARRQIGVVNTKPSISAKKAEKLVSKVEGIRGQLQAETKLMVYVEDGLTNLVWHVNLIGLDHEGLPVDRIALVDAHDGELLLSYDNLQTKRDDAPGQGGGDDDDDDDNGDSIAAIGSADTLYIDTVALATEEYTDGGFGMRDPSRGDNYTTDMLDKRTGDGELFIDDDNLWGDFTNNDRATVGAEAHFGASVTWEYYLNIHGRQGIYDDGKGVLSRVHFGRDEAEQIFYRALTAEMTPDTDFAGAKAATMQAALDLYGSETAQLVGAAWAACGVE